MFISNKEFYDLYSAVAAPTADNIFKARNLMTQICDREVHRCQEKQARHLREQGAFFNELAGILSAHPHTSFTPTDLCYAIPNFVERDITVQKVTFFFKMLDLLEDPDFLNEVGHDLHLAFDLDQLVITRTHHPDTVKISWGEPTRDFKVRRRK